MGRRWRFTGFIFLLAFIIHTPTGFAVLKKGDKFFPFSLRAVDEKIATVGEKVKRKIRYFLFFISVVLILVGLKLGEFKTVLEKAVTICLDCIGIG